MAHARDSGAGLSYAAGSGGRIEVYAVGILLALVPAVFGLWGNASFSRNVPVRVPDQARATTAVASVDTRPVQAAHHAGMTPAEHHHARHGADDPATHDVGDDHGGDRTGDRRGSGEPEPGDNHGGADDPATHDVGDDHGGRTGNTSGTSNTSGPGGGGGGGADDNTAHQAGGGGDSGSGKGGSDDRGSGGHGSDE